MRFSTDSIPVLALIAVLLALLPPRALAGDPFRVEGFKVERSADSAAHAKDQAYDEAVIAAFNTVIERLLPKAQVETLHLPESMARKTMVSMAISDEFAAGTAYRARLDFVFSREAIRRLLSARGVSTVESQAPPVLVIPVMIDNGEPHLWQKAAQWHDALSVLDDDNAIAPVRLPENDFADRAERADLILAGEHMTMEIFRIRYSAQGALVARIAPLGDTGAVSLRLTGSDAIGHLDYDLVVESGGYEAAAKRVGDAIAERWKAYGPHRPDSAAGQVVFTGSIGLPEENTQGVAQTPQSDHLSAGMLRR